MEQKSNHHTKRILRAAAGLLCLTVLTSWVLSGTLARYVTSAAGGDSAGVAAFVFDSGGTGSQAFDLSGITKPGDSKTYTFTVSNGSGTSVSEVALNYSFELYLDGSMPLVATITEADTGSKDPVLTATFPKTETSTDPSAGDTPAAVSDDTGNESAAVQTSDTVAPVTVTSAAVQLAAATATTKTYTLKIEWPKDKNEIKYASGSAAGTAILTVTAQQADPAEADTATSTPQDPTNETP
jgi:hypothetical protein